jgi:hypothetical protein
MPVKIRVMRGNRMHPTVVVPVARSATVAGVAFMLVRAATDAAIVLAGSCRIYGLTEPGNQNNVYHFFHTENLGMWNLHTIFCNFLRSY